MKINCSVYVFGRFADSYSQYPDDYTRSIFEQFYDKASATSQITVHRNGELIYYGYIRKLDDKQRYIGFCLLLNNVMLRDVAALFETFEAIVEQIVAQGNIVHLTPQGELTTTLKSLVQQQAQVEQIVATLKRKINSLVPEDIQQLPPFRYDLTQNDCASFNVKDAKQDIAEATAKYSYTYIYKDQDYDTVTLTSYRDTLRRLTSENETLKGKNKKLIRQHRQFGGISIIAIVAVICIAFALYALDERNDLKDELGFKKGNINDLQLANEIFMAQRDTLLNPTFTLYSMFSLLYKRLRLTPVVPVYYRFSL